MKMEKSGKWSTSKAEIFWKDIAPGEHVLQIYDDPEIFIKTLAAFVGTGINAGETVIIIAEPAHRKLLEEKLTQHVLQLDTLISDERYIALDARETLDSFMVGEIPDQEKFNAVISKEIRRAKGKENRKVRAFGEMVALLWETGNHEGTLLLEDFWNELLEREKISLFCAYPHSIINGSIQDRLHICNTHSKIIGDTKKPLTEVMYQEIPKSA